MRGRLAWLVFVLGCGDNGLGSHAPVLAPRPLVTAEDTMLVVDLDAVDADGDPITLGIVSQPTHGAAGLVAGTLTYTPKPNFNGTDSIELSAYDGTHFASETLSIEVTAVNDPPSGVADSFAADEDTAMAAPASALLANDLDVDGDPLELIAVRNPMHGTVELVDGEIRFVPADNYSGMASFEYLVTDGTLQVPVAVTVAVAMANDPPVAVDDTVTATEDVPRLLGGSALVGNDTDPDGQTLMVTEVANPTNGTVALAAGTVTFTPDPDFAGSATFDYTVSDGVATAVGHVTVEVGPVDDKPVAVDDAAETGEDTALELAFDALLANDTDIDGPALSIAAVQDAVNGTVALTDTAVTFTPDPGFVGAASFDYVVSDGSRTDIGHVTVEVVHLSVCGNTVVEPPEECDDGNTEDGDGCSGTCQKEVVSIAVQPGPVSIDLQQRVQLRAIATLFGGGTRDVTATSTWASTAPEFATVDPATGRVEGVATGATQVSATLGALVATSDVAVTAATCTLKINEVQTRGDGASSQADEFAELVNPCAFDVDVTGWNLVYRAATGTSDSATISTALTGTFPAGTFRLYAGVAYNGAGAADGTFGSLANGFADAGGGVAIRSGPLNTGAVVDAVAWGTATNAFANGPNAPAAPANQSFGRRPYDGADSDAAATDFVIGDATPRTTNIP